MEYTNNEKQILSLIERTDFKNLSKSDFLSYASKLNELRPEVASQVISQFPELSKLIQSTLSEYKGVLDTVVSSDDSSLNQTYSLINKEMDHADSDLKEYYAFAEKVRSDCSKCLDNPNLTVEQQQEILNRELEIMKLVDQKDSDVRLQEKEAVQEAEKKDSEKRMFNWKIIGAASTALVLAISIGSAFLGGNIDIKLPLKK